MKTRSIHLTTVTMSLAVLLCPVSILPQSASFVEQWNAVTSVKFNLRSSGRSLATSNVADTGTVDGKALRLLVGANVGSGPGNGSEVLTKTTFRSGTFSARLKTADCSGQPDAGIVTGLFSYFNDGTDQNGDGLPDNSEIDFEWLGAEPQSIYLTMWTDYRDSDEKHKRVSRKINLKTGMIEYCFYAENFGGTRTNLTGLENQPAAIAPLAGYNSAMAYFEYGFTWTAARVTWWMVLPNSGEKIILWDYQGPLSRIPARPSYYMINAWHTDTWPPEGRPTAILPPSSPVSAFVDWARYDSLLSVKALPHGPLPAADGIAEGPRAGTTVVFDCKGRTVSMPDGRSVIPRFRAGSGFYMVRSGKMMNKMVKCRP